MCGIAGVFNRHEPDTVRRMVARLHHRGPDDACVVVSEKCTLGTARLSIQDVVHGRQPVTDESGRILAALNGELYNFPVLRERLLSAGHQLSTHCDTEVLPHLYEEHGEALTHHLDGMFAVAIWDEATGAGLLARDRAGKKPLYYLEHDGGLWFASEIKALLEVQGFSRRLNPPALHHYLGYKHVPHPLSIFERIKQLPPGSRLVYRAGRPPQIEPYWRLSWAPRHEDLSDSEASDQFLGLLRAGVKKRLLSDVPVGFFLSGGLDSALTVAMAREVSEHPIKTFTLTYAHESATPGKEADRYWARWVANRFGTEHHEEEVHFTDFPANLRRILTHFDEPFAGVVSTYFLSQLISRHVKVAISGDGADELFGSYLSHRLAQPLAAWPDIATGGEFDANTLERLHAPADWQWRSRLLVFSDAEKSALYTPDFNELIRGVRTDEHLHATAFANLTAKDPLDRVLEAEFKSIFPDQVLTFVDRLSMAHSLEVRTAFLDTEVIEFAAALPARMKIRDGVTKYLLKHASARYFPAEMIHRPKEGFLMPITQWLHRDLQSYVRDVLDPARIRRSGVFDAARVASLVDRLYSSDGADYRRANQVYSLLVFQEWYDLYFA
jgi:asparagine synthase (glutamine-hydrolysing)